MGTPNNLFLHFDFSKEPKSVKNPLKNRGKGNTNIYTTSVFFKKIYLYVYQHFNLQVSQIG
jgi:hypothetical protein